MTIRTLSPGHQDRTKTPGTPYEKQPGKDTLGLVLRCLRVKRPSGDWIDLDPEAGQSVWLCDQKFLLVAAMFLKNAYRIWIHGDDGSYIAPAKDVSDTELLAKKVKRRAQLQRVQVLNFVCL